MDAGGERPPLDTLAEDNFLSRGHCGEGKEGDTSGQKRLIESAKVHTATLAAPQRWSHSRNAQPSHLKAAGDGAAPKNRGSTECAMLTSIDASTGIGR